jgi:hypothetical protein
MRATFIAAVRNPISAIGVALTAASAALFVSLITLEVVGLLDAPYVGIVVFVLVPTVFIIGLLLIPIGLWIERRRTTRGLSEPPWPRLDLNDPGIRHTVFFLAGATLVNVGLVSTASYGAVRFLESQTFCGQTCHHVMGPEFAAHQPGPHGHVHCVSCHVGPGARGFVAAKLNGTRQLALTITGHYRSPIPTPFESMPDVRNSCEQCHQPERFIGDVIKVFYEYADDAANTATKTTVQLHVGGPVTGTGFGTGIHWHMNRANVIEYIATDEKREQIPYVRVATPDGRVREFFAEGVTPDTLVGKERRRMGCLDCHNRPAHRFGATPERAVDAAIGEGLISTKIPFIRREAIRALRADYATQDEGVVQIDRTIRDAINAQEPHAFEEADLRQAIAVTQALYRRAVFPSMKIGWGTYIYQLGHTTSNGCFRCHDEAHKTRDGVAIRQDCEQCHVIG